ncbi:MAG TPA: glycosyltransferase [Phycisphaerales bacterium]|nr:glycosyltransferase [Phycisphaerales bacterium]
MSGQGAASKGGTPRVSVIMPVYNRERFVAAAIKSVLAQTYREFELLVCDDGSTDGSLAAAREAAGSDPRVRVLAMEHAGLAQTLKRAHAETRAAWIGWVDSDDMLAPAALERTATVLAREPSVGLVYTHHVMINDSGQTLGLGQRCTIPYSKDRLLVDFMTFHFRLYRREAYERAGGINVTFATAQDYDFCLRMSEVTQFACVAEPLYLYRMASDSISHVKRIEQIESSARAIREALVRRGLADKAELRVEIVGRFSIRPKGQGGWNQV